MTTGGSAPDLRSVIQPKPTPLTLCALELLQPGVVARRVRRRVRPVVAAVAQPQFRVLRDVLHLALHDPRVAAGGQPGGDPLAPVLALGVLPVGEQLAAAARREVAGGPAHQRAAQVVARHAAVPVGRTGAPGEITNGGLDTIRS